MDVTEKLHSCIHFFDQMIGLVFKMVLSVQSIFLCELYLLTTLGLRYFYHLFHILDSVNSDLIYHGFIVLPSSAKAQAQAGLSWLYSQLIQPPTHPHPGKFFLSSS